MNILEVKNKYGVTRYEVYRNHEYVGYIVNRNTWGDEWVASSEQDAFLGRGKIFAEARRFFRDAEPKNPKYTPVRERLL